MLRQLSTTYFSLDSFISRLLIPEDRVVGIGSVGIGSEASSGTVLPGDTSTGGVDIDDDGGGGGGDDDIVEEEPSTN